MKNNLDAMLKAVKTERNFKAIFIQEKKFEITFTITEGENATEKAKRLAEEGQGKYITSETNKLQSIEEIE